MKLRQLFTFGLMMYAISGAAQYPLIERVTYSNPIAMQVAEDDIEWQRIVYREISANNSVNAGLFYQSEGDCLFSHIFKAVMEGKVTAYSYGTNDNTMFSQHNIVEVASMLKNFHIPYEKNGDALEINPNDIPSDLIKAYYIQESHFYDKRNSSFRKRCLAICPVIMQMDEFDTEEIKYPMFWIKYSDIEPVLQDVLVFSDVFNSNSVMSVSEFFASDFYEGDIYKVFGMRNSALRQYCKDDDDVKREQRRIEEELLNVKLSCYDITKKNKPMVIVPEVNDTSENSPVKRVKGVFKNQK